MAALCGSTGRPEMSVFQTSSAGNMGQLGAPGTGEPADATPGVTPIVSPSHVTAPATNAASAPLSRRPTGVPSLIDGTAPGEGSMATVAAGGRCRSRQGAGVLTQGIGRLRAFASSHRSPGQRPFSARMRASGRRLPRRERRRQEPQELREHRRESSLAPLQVRLVGEGLAEHARRSWSTPGRRPPRRRRPDPAVRRPRRRRARRAGDRPSRWLGANASGDGSKLGTGRQKSNSATARLASAHRPLASSPAQRRSPGSASRHGAAHDVEVLELTPEEQRVVDRHQRREVLVERRRLDAEAPRHLGEAQAVHPFFGHHLDGDVEDLLDRLLPAPRPAVRAAAVSAAPSSRAVPSVRTMP